MFKVEHAITVGSSRLSTSDRSGRVPPQGPSLPRGGGSTQSSLLELDIRATFTAPANRCRIILAPDLDAAIRPGDPVEVELGYDGRLHRVFTGRVTSCERGLQAVEVEALSALALGASAFLNLLYEKQTAGDIVSDVVGRLELSKGTIDSGVTFASYALGDRQSISLQLHSLARRCGFDLYADPEDRVVFKKYAPAKTHDFEYGVNILEFAQDFTPKSFEGVEVYGESPAGQGQGEDASSWLTKKEVKGAAGETSGQVLRIVDPAARSQNMARDLAQNVLDGDKAEARGRVRTPGAPEVRLGDAIQISKLPLADQNGTYRVIGIRHCLNGRRGFITDVAWEKV